MRTRSVLLLGAIACVALFAWSRRASPPPPVTDPVRSAAVSHAHELSATTTVRTDIDQQIDDKLARDPIAQVIPMLLDYSKPKQLETLYWMKYAPHDKLLAFFPQLPEGIEPIEMIDGFIADLEREGIKAPRF